MRRAIAAVVVIVILTSVTSLSASAQSQDIFYLHDGYVLDESAPTSTEDHYLLLNAAQRYIWKSDAFATERTYAAGTWVTTIWMSISETQTQYKVELGVVDQSGTFASSSSSFTTLIRSFAPTIFDVTMPVETLSLGVGDSLAVSLLRQSQDGSDSSAAFIFFDSVGTPSRLTSTSYATSVVPTTTITTQTTSVVPTTTITTQTTSVVPTTTITTQPLTTSTTHATTSGTTQYDDGDTPNIGFAFAFVAVGAGIASAMGGLGVVAASRPNPQVFAWGGYYYCGKHRVPLYSSRGWLWCPRERRYLLRQCLWCNNALRHYDRFCDRCGRAVQ